MNAAASISFAEWLAWNDAEAARWRAWFQRQDPGLLDVPVTIANAGTVRGLLLHIFGVELRHAERLSGQPALTPDELLPSGSVDALFSIGERARAMLRDYLERATSGDLREVIAVQTRSAGPVEVSRRKLALHVLVHGLRHWAQLATELRRAGFPTDWPHDAIFAKELE